MVSARHLLAALVLAVGPSAIGACAITFPDYPEEPSNDGGLGSTCDGTGDCTQCKTCSAMKVCETQYQGCIADGACELVVTCAAQSCMPPEPSCLEPCLMGATDHTRQLFAAFYDCIVCNACRHDCTQVAAAPLCP